MRVLTPLAIALLLVAAPLGAASWWTAHTEPLTVRTAAVHVGDVVRYEYRETVDGESGDPRTLHVAVEGPTTASDKFGIDRETDAYLIEIGTGDDSVTLRCHALRGSNQSVREDTLAGGSYQGRSNATNEVLGVPVYELSVMLSAQMRTSFSPSPCLLREATMERALTEGSQMTSGELLRHGDNITGKTGSNLSSPAVATEFHGRPALSFTYFVTGEPGERLLVGNITYTFAEGLPGAVCLAFDGTEQPIVSMGTRNGEPYTEYGPTQDVQVVLELTGYLQGTGPLLDPITGARLPTTPPSLPMVPFDPLRFDETGIPFSFPLREALASLSQDPTTTFGEFMAEHPKAFLLHAGYNTENGNPFHPDAAQAAPDAEWWLWFSDLVDSYLVTSARYGGFSTPAGWVDTPVRPVKNDDGGAFGRLMYGTPSPTSGNHTFPEAMLDGAVIARLLEKELGTNLIVTEASLGRVPHPETGEWFSDYTITVVNEKENGETLPYQVWIDATSGAILLIHQWDWSATTTLLPDVFPPSETPEWTTSLSAAAPPPFLAAGTGLAVASAALSLAALVLLAVKFLLLPLYTRLRRDRLLDHPVRARLYEATRANPGIHRADLIDLAGGAEGSIRRHLEKLVEARLLVEARFDRLARYYCAGDLPPATARQEAVLRGGRNREVYTLLLAEPGLSLRDVGARLGMSAPGVHRCVKKLREAGLLPTGSDSTVTLVAGEP